MTTVTYDHATRFYPESDIPAVDQLSLDIGDGEFLVLVGAHVTQPLHDPPSRVTPRRRGDGRGAADRPRLGIGRESGLGGGGVEGGAVGVGVGADDAFEAVAEGGG
jgi:hypothetical protein